MAVLRRKCGGMATVEDGGIGYARRVIDSEWIALRAADWFWCASCKRIFRPDALRVLSFRLGCRCGADPAVDWFAVDGDSWSAPLEWIPRELRVAGAVYRPPWGLEAGGG